MAASRGGGSGHRNGYTGSADTDLYTRFHRSPQHHHLAESLRRRQWLRQELDAWNQRGGKGNMPQPHDFGLSDPDLLPSMIWWGAVI